MAASTASAAINWRTIDIDALDPDSPANFDLSTLAPSVTPVSAEEAQAAASRVRQTLRGGDGEGALLEALANPPYGADAKGKEAYSQAITETLQSIRASEMTPLLRRVYEAPGGVELLDVLMKYLYKGMAVHPSTAANGTSRTTMTPQPTGFSQAMGGRPGAGGESGGQAMSVLLSWHEKLVEIAGAGCIVRVMADRRTV